MPPSLRAGPQGGWSPGKEPCSGDTGILHSGLRGCSRASTPADTGVAVGKLGGKLRSFQTAHRASQGRPSLGSGLRQGPPSASSVLTL